MTASRGKYPASQARIEQLEPQKMALIDIWKTDRAQITDKRIDQLIAFAGEGRLRDGSATAVEFRELLSVVSSDVVGTWIDECLQVRFTDFGFAIQDLVNEIGGRLGFEVTNGVYRGHSNEGYDGLWQLEGSRAILVEAKSSTAYSINLSRISDYRKQVAPALGVRPEDVSILIVVGEDDTFEFEAQVRGSRFAWDIRLIGISALYRLLRLRETLDDPTVERQIQEILFPQEFTRLDKIIDLVFATAEDASNAEESPPDSEDVDIEIQSTAPSAPRANFHSAIMPRLEAHFKQPLVRRSRVQWATSDDATLVSCQVSKTFKQGPMDYWFGLKRTTSESLDRHKNAMSAFGLGSPQHVVLLPYVYLRPYLDGFFTSPDADGQILHWHVRFKNTATGVSLLVNRDRELVDVTKFLLH